MRPTSQSASGPDGQSSHTCLEVSKQLCWGPGERSVLGVLPDLELSLPEGGQVRERTDVTMALPKAMLAPVRQSSIQSHNLTPSSPCSASQIRPWKSGSMWSSQPVAYSPPYTPSKATSHLQFRILGHLFRVNTRMLLFISFLLKQIKIILSDSNIHARSQEAGLKHVCTSGIKQSHMWPL